MQSFFLPSFDKASHELFIISHGQIGYVTLTYVASIVILELLIIGQKYNIILIN